MQSYDHDRAETHLLSKSVEEMRFENETKVKESWSEPRAAGNLLERLKEADRSMWADKYEAGKFAHLVTDDYVNREAALWLESWNKTVFKDNKKKPQSAIANQRKEGRKDILLLSGPSGCGKTTLAKVVALHCKYKPFIIDCTIEASAANLIQKVTNAMSIESIHKGEPKSADDKSRASIPQCVILDQIESLDKSTLQQLENMAKKPLKRPLIAIVTDFYAPMLKHFKAQCQVLQCKLCPIARMQLRLTEICRLEGLQVDQNALMHLLGHSNNDVRSCLNGLQMMMIGRPPNSYVSLEEAKLCLNKDLRHTAFDLWKQIFSKKDLENLPRLLLDMGELELVNQGIYENFTNVECQDFEFAHSTMLLDSLALDDVVELRIKEKQQYELMGCQTLPARIANHFFNASLSEIQFPVMNSHISKAITECTDTLRVLELEASRKVCKTSIQTTLEDIWPYAFPLINPSPADSRKLQILHFDLFKDFGFSIISKSIEPALHRIIRLPANISLPPSTIDLYERFFSTPKLHAVASYNDISKDSKVVKRKRQSLEGASVLFKYKEGLTNAVKRKVRVSDLLPRKR